MKIFKKLTYKKCDLIGFICKKSFTLTDIEFNIKIYNTT